MPTVLQVSLGAVQATGAEQLNSNRGGSLAGRLASCAKGTCTHSVLRSSISQHRVWGAACGTTRKSRMPVMVENKVGTGFLIESVSGNAICDSESCAGGGIATGAQEVDGIGHALGQVFRVQINRTHIFVAGEHDVDISSIFVHGFYA